jgi:hypothetical protein
MEPTGFWYSSFWYHLAKHNNIKVCWIGHKDLSDLRGSYGFTNKNDETDAVCLAASYLDKRFIDEHGRQRFLRHYLPEEILKVRENFYACEQLDKIRNQMINQIRQRLAAEFPEMAKYTFSRQGKYDYSPALGWIAGIKKHPKLENLWNRSESKRIGLGLTIYTREHAKAIIDLEVRLSQTERLLKEELEKDHFKKYMKIFNMFGFGQTLKSLFLLNCYPFERFLIKGKPHIERETSKPHIKNGKQEAGGKPITKHISVRQFQAYLGLAYSELKSGTSKKERKFHGSKIIRTHLYAFIMARICTGEKRRVQTEIGQELGKSYQKLKEKGIHGKDAIVRTEFKLTRKLFYELYKELKNEIE